MARKGHAYVLVPAPRGKDCDLRKGSSRALRIIGDLCTDHIPTLLLITRPEVSCNVLQKVVDFLVDLVVDESISASRDAFLGRKAVDLCADTSALRIMKPRSYINSMPYLGRP